MAWDLAGYSTIKVFSADTVWPYDVKQCSHPCVFVKKNSWEEALRVVKRKCVDRIDAIFATCSWISGLVHP